jgi:hypothetical protein
VRCSAAAGTARAGAVGIDQLPLRVGRPWRVRTSMNPSKAPWEKGDFTRIAASMRESGAAHLRGRRGSR